MEIKKGKKIELEETAATYESGINTSDNWKLYQGNQKHGFMAEKMNHDRDIMSFKEAEIIGGDNAKNGADRIVNGELIQTKFYQNAKGSVEACFDDKTKLFKYLDPNGNPMSIEVPKDQVEEVIGIFKNKIEKGLVEGVTDPNEAYKLVKSSPYTYDQVVKATKFGTKESLMVDSIDSLKTSAAVGGLVGLYTFGKELYNGKDLGVASVETLKKGAVAGVKTQVISVASRQLIKTEAAGLVKKKLTSVTMDISKNLFNTNLKHDVVKNLTGNMAAGTVIAVMSIGSSLMKYGRGELDELQLLEELGEKGTAFVGSQVVGTVGAVAGAVIGSAVPIVGTIIGETIGYAVGSMVGYLATQMVYNNTILVFKEAKIAEERREIITEISREIRKMADQEKIKLEKYLNETLKEKRKNIGNMLVMLEESIMNDSMGVFQKSIESIGQLYNLDLRYKTFDEFNQVMENENEKIIF